MMFSYFATIESARDFSLGLDLNFQKKVQESKRKRVRLDNPSKVGCWSTVQCVKSAPLPAYKIRYASS